MNRKQLDRRTFNALGAAAFGGMVTGTMIGCGGSSATTEGDVAADGTSADDGDTSDVAAADADVHVCRGLNACQGKGPSGENACAGMGQCATAAAHSCHGENDCKGQGGCGETAGQNECKGMGECAVPLSEETWTKARAAFEAAMTEAGTEFGEAPPKES